MPETSMAVAREAIIASKSNVPPECFSPVLNVLVVMAGSDPRALMGTVTRV
jgi:hypothetical protein